MPMYRFRSKEECGAHHDIALGFYRDQAAVEHPRKLARRSGVEVWREEELVAQVERVI